MLLCGCHKGRIHTAVDAGRHRRGRGAATDQLSGVDFVDSSGLGAIVSCLKRLGPRGNLAIAGAKGAVSRLFTLTRMDKVFTLHDSVDAAVAQLSA